MGSVIRKAGKSIWLKVAVMAAAAACLIPLASNFASNRAFAAGTVDPSVLSVSTSTPTVTVESSDASQASETLDVTYNASVGDVLTATIPDTFKGDIKYDTEINGSKVTKSGNVISVTFTKAGKISDFQITLTPDRTTMNNDESPLSKVGNSDYMQVGDYTVDFSATKSGTQYSASTTFKMQPLTSDIPTWSAVKLNGRTYTKNVTYTLTDLDFGIADNSSSNPITNYDLNSSTSAYLQVPGGFLLDAAQSTKGLSQPSGAGTPVVWNNPNKLGSRVSAMVVGKFTSPAGTYSTSLAPTSTYSGYFGYSNTLTTVKLANPVWSVKIVDHKDPQLVTGGAQTALIGTAANKASNIAETQFTQSMNNGNTEEAQKSVTMSGAPTVDGSALTGGYVTVYSKVGETVSFTGTKKDRTSATQNTTFTAADAVGNVSSTGYAYFTVKLPATTEVNPYTDMKVTASLVSKGGMGLNVKYQYQALDKLTNGTALTDGLVKTSAPIKITETGVDSGYTFTGSDTLSVKYYDSIPVNTDVTCNAILSESGNSCVSRFGDEGTVGMTLESPAQTSGSSQNFRGTLLDQPIAYFMLPKYAEYTGINKASRTAQSLALNNFDNILQVQNEEQQPEVSTSTLPNGQTLVKLDWTGKGKMSLDSLGSISVNYKYPSHMVDSKSLVAAWIDTSNNPSVKVTMLSNALQEDVPDSTVVVMKSSPKIHVAGTMYAEVAGPKLLSGGIDIIDNTGVKSQAAENNIKNGTKHSIDIEVFSNESVATPKIAGLLNLPSDSDGLGLNLTGAGTIEDIDGNKIADTGAATDKAYLLYSTKAQPVTSSDQAIDTSGYVRASQITDWSSVRSVVLYVPSLESQDWYTANLPLDAPKAADQVGNKVSIPLNVFSAEKQYEANDPVTDVFTSDVPAWLKTTPRGGRAYEDGVIDPSKLVDLTKIPDDFDRSDTDLVWEMSDYAPGNGYTYNTAAKAQKLGVLTLKAGSDTPTWTWDASCDSACQIMEGTEVYKVRIAAGTAPSTHDASKTDVTDVSWAPGATESKPVEVPVEVYTPQLVTRDQVITAGDEAKFSDSADATIKWMTEDSCTADGTTLTDSTKIDSENCDATEDNDITSKPTVDTHFWFIAGSDPKDDSAGMDNTSEPYGSTTVYHPAEVTNLAVGVTLTYGSGADAKKYDYAQGQGHENDGSQYANVTSQLTTTDTEHHVVVHSATSVGTEAFSTERHRKSLAVAQEDGMIYGEVSRPDAVEDLPHNAAYPVTIYVKAGGCYLGGTAVPDKTACPALSDDASVTDGAAYEYAVIGGGDDGTGTDGYKSLLVSSDASTLVTDNPTSTLTWSFTDADGNAIGTYTVTPGKTFDQGTWAFTDGAKNYLEGVGNHEVSVTLTSSDHTGDAYKWTSNVDVYVPLAQVSDSKVTLGASNQMQGNLGTNAIIQKDNGVYWSDAQYQDTDTEAQPVTLTSKPDSKLQAVFLAGTDPKKVMEDGDSFKPSENTTFKAQVVLSGGALSTASPAYDTASSTKLVGPSGQTWMEDTDATHLVKDGATFLVNAQFNMYLSENKAGVSIGAVTNSAEAFEDRDGSKAAFTVYVDGPVVAHLPLTGGLGSGRVALAVTLGTLLLAGVVWFVSVRSRKGQAVSAE